MVFQALLYQACSIDPLVGCTICPMRIKTIPLIVALCFAGSLRTAQACVCSEPAVSDREEAAAEFQAAAVVFEGELLPGGHEISTWNGKPGLSMIPFRVIRSYKRASDEFLEVYDAHAGTDCGFGEPKPGTKFFVYGFRGEDGKIYIQACSRTASLDAAGADIRFGRNDPPTKEDLAPPGEKWRLYRDPTLTERGASLIGKVRREDGGDVSHVFLTLWDVDENGARNRAGSIAARQKVNGDGSFEIRFLASGQYDLTAEDLHENSTAEYVAEFGNVTLTERQVLSNLVVNLHPQPLGTVRVTVIAPPELHDRIVVWLTEAETESVGKFPDHCGHTGGVDAQSEASFDSVPYGHYNVYVMLTGDDLTKPSWTHDEVQVELNGNHAEAVVKLRKVRVSDHQP